MFGKRIPAVFFLNIGVVLSALILSFSATGYAEEIELPIILEHTQASVFLQSSDQIHLSGAADAADEEQEIWTPSLKRRGGGYKTLVAGGCAGGCLVGPLGGVIGMVIGSELAGCSQLGCGMKEALIGLSIGYTIGNTYGVYMVGTTGGDTGPFLAALVGSILGAMPGLANWLTTEEVALSMVLSSMGATLGAVWAFDITQRTRSPSEKIGLGAPLRVPGEIIAGGAGGLAGVLAGGSVIRSMKEIGVDSDGIAASVLAVSSAFGCASCVYAVGNIGDETGSLLATLAGSALGIAVGLLGNYACDRSDHEIAAIIFLLASPPIGATIGFNMTRRYKLPPAEPGTALMNVRDGRMSLAFPRVYIQMDPFGKGNLSQKVDLLRVRF